MDENEDELIHIGIKRRSGRYPWGSGNDPYQRSVGFRSFYDDLKKQGFSDSDIASHIDAMVKQSDPHLKFKTTDLRAAIAISSEEIRAANVARAVSLRGLDGDTLKMSPTAIGKEMGVNESTVRGWLKNAEDMKKSSLRATADRLKEEVDGKEFLDVGKGNHLALGITDVKLRTSLAMLKDEGYEVWSVKLPQAGRDTMTTYKVLTKEGVPWGDAKDAVLQGKLGTIGIQSDDGGMSFRTKTPPVSVDSKRIQVLYGPEGGSKMDGVIELRRGVEDLSLGGDRYAQVRVAVDGSHYLKGMAMYADDLPNGVDIRFNTNKTSTGNKLDAMKPMKMQDGKPDPDNPFGATTRQKTYIDKDGKEKVSPLNAVNEEGKWDQWSKSLSSQMLSKQSLTLANNQLAEERTTREDDFNEIMRLTNPVVRKKLLEEFSENADAAAVHLKAAAMPRQSTNVILPINSVRRNEIYAPNFEQGEKVVLIRHPHGGPFEIPELTVNKRNPQARRILGNARDAVGIHHSVAEQLSGADFDGDTVLVIPNDRRLIKTARPLKDLEGFDPKRAYPEVEGMTYMTKKSTQNEMGRISNLITDMTIKGANEAEIARAVKHSMVVIDAEKHKLNYKLSYQQNAIAQLKEKYQGGPRKGASTIISRASSEDKVPQRKQLSGAKGINPKTGEKVFVDTGRTYTRTNPKTGRTEVVTKYTHGTKMEFVKDAKKLMSDDPQPMERIYADHANSLKSLANLARKESVKISSPKQNAYAKTVYKDEIQSLDEKLKIALRNAPLERRAQSIGKAMADAKIEANPGYDKEEIKRVRYQALEEGRRISGANKIKIGAKDENGHSTLTAREWEAIQAGAISASKLREILNHADMDRVRELAQPRARTALTPGQLARARQMEATGRSMSEIARELGLPRSTVSDNLSV